MALRNNQVNLQRRDAFERPERARRNWLDPNDIDGRISSDIRGGASSRREFNKNLTEPDPVVGVRRINYQGAINRLEEGKDPKKKLSDFRSLGSGENNDDQNDIQLS